MPELKTFPKTSNKSRLSTALFTLGLFAFWALIFNLSPMTEDDTHFWSLRIRGISEVFQFAFNYGNGRLLGNMGILYMVEYKLLRVLVKAAVMSGLCLLLPGVLGLRCRRYYFMSFLLLCLVAPELFAQVYTWTSGFQNYLPPIFLQLLLLWLLLRCRRGWLMMPVALLLGMVMQLYVEHSSVISVITAALLCLYAFRCRRSMLPGAAGWLVGSLAGLAIMLLIPRIAPELMLDMAVYKSSIFDNGLAAAAVTMAKNGLVLLAQYSGNVFLIVALSVLMSLVIRDNPGSFKAFELKALPVVMISAAVLLAVGNLDSMGTWYGDVALFETLLLATVMGLWLISFVYAVLKLAVKKRDGKTLLLAILVLLAVVAAAPGLLLQPLVIRLVYHSYIFLSAACLLLMDMVDFKALGSYLGLGLCAASVVTAVALSGLFMDIDRMVDIREEYIRTNVEAGQLQLDYFMVPSDYVFDYFDDYVYSLYYKSLYQADVQLNAIPADVWINRHYYDN